MDTSGQSGWSIRELAELAGTTPRTIRYYLAEGLLPAPGMRGRYALYSRDHLNRLRLILRLKDAFLPLASIRSHLGRLTPDQISILSDGNVHLLHRDADDAARYLARVLEVIEPASELHSPNPRPKRALWIGRQAPKAAEEALPDQSAAEVWRRYPLGDGVELHVRDGEAMTGVDEGQLEEIRRILFG